MSASSPCDLRLVGHGGELPGQADRLGGEVDVAGVALVEDDVEHPQHRRQVSSLVEADVGDGALGAADPLRHRRLGDEVGLGDLARGEAADRAQGQRDGGGRGEGGVSAEEVQVERVVLTGHRPGLHRRLDGEPRAGPATSPTW